MISLSTDREFSSDSVSTGRMEQLELSDGVTPPFLITNNFRKISLNCIALGLLFNPQRKRIMPKKML